VDEDGCSSACVAEFCGDGTLQTGLGEVCDDGNTVDGDGCSTTCSAVTFCSASPNPSCAVASKASLNVAEKKPGNEELKVRLEKLEATELADFGDPIAGTTVYEVCIYDAGGSLAASLTVDRATQSCGAKPCWKAAKNGYRYKDRDKVSDGVKKLSTRAGESGKGKVTVLARNRANKDQTELPTGVASLLAGDTSATVQVVTSDASCTRAELTDVEKADASQFKASTP
jgi:cysteine-rich repeat protein